MDATTLLAAWRERDREFTWLPDDRRALEAAGPLRALVAELLVGARGNDSHDLYSACSRLGGELCAQGASPTLVAGALDGARTPDSPLPEATWQAARAALFEGYGRMAHDLAERASFASWEPPRCFVLLEGGAAAICANHPAVDPDMLAAWAGRVAGALMIRGIRQASVAGSGPAAEAMMHALASARIAAHPSEDPGSTRVRVR